MADDPVDTGFDAVLAGERFEDAPVTATVTAPMSADQLSGCTTTDDQTAGDRTSGDRTSDNKTAGNQSSVGLTKEGKNAALALVALPAMTPPELAQLARELAMNIRPRGDILHGFKLTETQYEFLEQQNEFFAAAFRAACTEWHAPLNTQERIKVEAAAILEDSLVGLGARMQNRAEGLPGVVEVAKLFAKVAGVGERETSAGPAGERFVINIDLGGDKTITVSAEAPQAVAAQQRGQLAVPDFTETKGS